MFCCFLFVCFEFCLVANAQVYPKDKLKSLVSPHDLQTDRAEFIFVANLEHNDTKFRANNTVHSDIFLWFGLF